LLITKRADYQPERDKPTTGKGSVLVNKVVLWSLARLKSWHLSLFEKVILVNSVMLIVEAIAGLWVTSHNIEAHHYLIDTSFIVSATLFTLFINALLLRASFRPLFHLLATIRQVSTGNTQARAVSSSTSGEIGELASAFNSMLDRLEAARQEQTMLIIQAQEEERRRIALELHDDAGQNLTALLIHTEILSQQFQMLPESATNDAIRQQLTGELQQLTRLTQQTLENIRLLSQQLRPSVLDDLGLLAALRWLVEDSQQRLQLDVACKIEGIKQDSSFPHAYETALFRIAQESLTNIARHARTQKAEILLKQDRQSIHLRISDQGCGYDPATIHKGSGIVGMRERAELLKGRLLLHTQPGHGTAIEAIIPLPKDYTDEGQAKGQIYVH
jgi:two-component system sensor histidine kinase UhpB